MALLQWGLHELNRKLATDPDREAKLLAAMQARLQQDEKEVYLFLGSYRGVQYNFGLMDTYTAPKNRQEDLFI
jgi:hypothetical protein